jgi:multiple antibiotic resistance protein
MLREAADAFLLIYAGLLPIVNPFGAAPVFLSFTHGYPSRVRHRMAWSIAVNGFFLLLASLFVGSHILEFFGITLPVVRVAGGIVVTTMGWRLLTQGDDPTERHPPAAADERRALDQAFYPLTMPLTVGPGAITAAITLGSQRPARETGFEEWALLGGSAVVSLAAICATVYVCYRYAENIERLLGRSGTNVMVRLCAFIVLCIGVQILWGGYSALVASGAR